MTTMKARLQADMTEAMKSRQQLRLDTLRMVKSATKLREVAEMRELNDSEVLQVLRTLIKQRRESVEQYLKGGRNDLAEKETTEIEILEAYLPPALTTEELEKIIEETLVEMGAPQAQQMGLVMKSVMGKLAGQNVDGKRVSELVKAKLQAGTAGT